MRKYYHLLSALHLLRCFGDASASFSRAKGARLLYSEPGQREFQLDSQRQKNTFTGLQVSIRI